MQMSKIVVVGFMGTALAVSACGAESAQPAGDEAPDMAVSTSEAQDQGASYNGWTQTPYMVIDIPSDYAEVRHTFTRSYGDSTRGGGGCHVILSGSANLPAAPPTSCTSDTTCTTAARAMWGSAAFGYCYSGYCYDRMGSPTSSCVTNQNRTPGVLTLYLGGAFSLGDAYALGCMTKAAGPSAACGGTNASLYMRTVVPAEVIRMGGGGGGF